MNPVVFEEAFAQKRSLSRAENECGLDRLDKEDYSHFFYICVCTHVYTCVHVCGHTCAHTHLLTYIHVCMDTDTHVYTCEEQSEVSSGTPSNSFEVEALTGLEFAARLS